MVRNLASGMEMNYVSPHQTRSSCWRSGISGFSSLERLLDSNDVVIRPVNVGNPVKFAMKELARLVLEKTGSDSVLEYQPLPSDDFLQRQTDIALTKQVLDWELTVDLAARQGESIRYFQSI